MIISFRSSMRNKQHTDIAHDVVLGIQAFICRLFLRRTGDLPFTLFAECLPTVLHGFLSLGAVQAQEARFQHLFYMDLCL